MNIYVNGSCPPHVLGVDYATQKKAEKWFELHTRNGDVHSVVAAFCDRAGKPVGTWRAIHMLSAKAQTYIRVLGGSNDLARLSVKDYDGALFRADRFFTKEMAENGPDHWTFGPYMDFAMIGFNRKAITHYAVKFHWPI